MNFPHPLTPSIDSTTGAPVLGFEHDGMFITDPTIEDGGGRWKVDPMEFYGVSDEQAAWLKDLNRELATSFEEALNGACLRIQKAVGATSGDLAGLFFADEAHRQNFSLALAEYALLEARASQGMAEKPRAAVDRG